MVEFNLYVPTCLPSFIAGNSVLSVGSPVSGSMNFAGWSPSIFIGTSESPAVNCGVSFCSFPCFPVDVLSSPLGVTSVTVGVYFAVAGVPLASLAWTVTPSGVPTKSLFGVNVISPVSGFNLYVPTCLPSFIAGNSVLSVGSFVVGSTNFTGFEASIVSGTSESPAVNCGVSFCSFPCFPVDVLSSPLGVTSVTVGVYFAVAGVPLASLAWTVTPSGVPTKSLFGVNVISPVVGFNLYVPTCLPSFIAGNSVLSVGSFVVGSTNFTGLESLTTIGTFCSAPFCCLNVIVSD